LSIYKRGKSWYYDFVRKGQRYTGSFGAVSRTVAKEEEHRIKTRVIEGVLNPYKARKSPRFDTFAQEYLEWVQANGSRRPTRDSPLPSLVSCPSSVSRNSVPSQPGRSSSIRRPERMQAQPRPPLTWNWPFSRPCSGRRTSGRRLQSTRVRT
jgi:hypothetical protein